MRNLLTIVLLFVASSAFANTCVIVVPVGPGWNSEAIHNHELAHCNGYRHARYKKAVAAFGYQGEKPPRRFVHAYAGKFEPRFETPADTRKICKAVSGIPSYGCQWFE